MPATTLRLLKSALAPCSCRVGRAGPHHTARPRQGTCSEGQAPLELRGRGVCHATWIRATRDGSEGHTLTDTLLLGCLLECPGSPSRHSIQTILNIDLSVIIFMWDRYDVCVCHGAAQRRGGAGRLKPLIRALFSLTVVMRLTCMQRPLKHVR